MEIVVCVQSAAECLLFFFLEKRSKSRSYLDDIIGSLFVLDDMANEIG